ncbi:MAG: hypothetical protein Q7S80_00450, partial [bacterium]|nr:hypothetical protein [bacterium]
LCTIGAGAVAVGASFLGVKDIVTGIFIGAFAVALGLWSAKLIKKQFIRFQNEIITIVIFLLTVLPVSQVVKSYLPLYIDWGGAYGSVFNRTYVFNALVVGSVIGALIMLISPRLSRKLKDKRGHSFPFQTMAIIFVLLIITGLVLQLTTTSY